MVKLHLKTAFIVLFYEISENVTKVWKWRCV